MLYALYWESSLRSATVICEQTYQSDFGHYKQPVDEASIHRGQDGACSGCMVGSRSLELPVVVDEVLPHIALSPTLLGIEKQSLYKIHVENSIFSSHRKYFLAR